MGLFVQTSLSSQTVVEQSPVNWMTIEQADSLFDKNPKPMLIDVYTDWCGWCKYMMQTTFASKGIASYINQNFYPVRFNAETSDTVNYQGRVYVNNGKGKRPKHDFAAFILNGRFSFPTIVFSDRNRRFYPIPGYRDIKGIEPLLVYFAEDINVNAVYSDWERLYKFSYPDVYKEDILKIDSAYIPDTSGVVRWYGLKEASDLCLKYKKPLLIYFYTDWCQSCKIEEYIVFKNPVTADLMNNKFYCVKMNAASTDDEILFGDLFKGTGRGRPHNLTYALLKQSFKFPAFVFISPNKQKLNETHGFLLPHQLESVLNYFAGGEYAVKSFDEFLKTFKSKIKH